MNTVIRKIGNSEGIIIPKEILARLKVKSGDVVDFIETEEGVMIRPGDERFERQMKIAREVMDKYRVALSKLAK
jgi:putative addiction module antidote